MMTMALVRLKHVASRRHGRPAVFGGGGHVDDVTGRDGGGGGGGGAGAAENGRGRAVRRATSLLALQGAAGRARRPPAAR